MYFAGCNMNYSIIAKYVGRDIYLTDSENWKSPVFKAQIQPLRYKNKMYIEGIPTPIGTNTSGYYTYIGPPAHDLSKLSINARVVDSHGKKYTISHSEKLFVKQNVFYIWAILKETSEVNQ